MDKQALLLINPKAGRADSQARVFSMADSLCRQGYSPRVHISQYRGQIPELIEKLGSSTELIIAYGGDGTLNETVNGIMKSGWKGRLGYIPAGTVNDFANSLSIPRSFAEGLHVALEGIPTPVDLGKFGGRYFTYVAACGLFTDVSYQTPQQSKNVLGKLAYILEGAKRLSSIPSYDIRIEHDGRVLHESIMLGLITNSRFVGGFPIGSALDASLSDGLLEVTLLRKTGTPKDLQTLINALLAQKLDDSHIITFKSSHLKISSPSDINWTLDGEFGGEVNNVEVKAVPSALNIMVNYSQKE